MNEDQTPLYLSLCLHIASSLRFKSCINLCCNLWEDFQVLLWQNKGWNISKFKCLKNKMQLNLWLHVENLCSQTLYRWKGCEGLLFPAQRNHCPFPLQNTFLDYPTTLSLCSLLHCSVLQNIHEPNAHSHSLLQFYTGSKDYGTVIYSYRWMQGSISIDECTHSKYALTQLTHPHWILPAPNTHNLMDTHNIFKGAYTSRKNEYKMSICASN